eukprot:1381175-Prymnesium_polylepis.1
MLFFAELIFFACTYLKPLPLSEVSRSMCPYCMTGIAQAAVAPTLPSTGAPTPTSDETEQDYNLRQLSP